MAREVKVLTDEELRAVRAEFEDYLRRGGAEGWGATPTLSAYVTTLLVLDLVATVEALQAPLDALLFCPACKQQHVDAPEPENGWENPPHKSHLCAACRTVWRPAARPTNGVERVASRGSSDTWPGEEEVGPPAHPFHYGGDLREGCTFPGCGRPPADHESMRPGDAGRIKGDVEEMDAKYPGRDAGEVSGRDRPHFDMVCTADPTHKGDSRLGEREGGRCRYAASHEPFIQCPGRLVRKRDDTGLIGIHDPGHGAPGRDVFAAAQLAHDAEIEQNILQPLLATPENPYLLPGYERRLPPVGQDDPPGLHERRPRPLDTTLPWPCGCKSLLNAAEPRSLCPAAQQLKDDLERVSEGKEPAVVIALPEWRAWLGHFRCPQMQPDDPRLLLCDRDPLHREAPALYADGQPCPNGPAGAPCPGTLRSQTPRLPYLLCDLVPSHFAYSTPHSSSSWQPGDRCPCSISFLPIRRCDGTLYAPHPERPYIIPPAEAPAPFFCTRAPYDHVIDSQPPGRQPYRPGDRCPFNSPHSTADRCPGRLLRRREPEAPGGED